MKYIRKQEQPKSFTEWKAKQKQTSNYSYDNLQNPEKAELHQSLLEEQGYLCCYCCGRISIEKSHIEHLKPQTNYPKSALDYKNLLASCGSQKRFPEYCGHAKGDDEISITPLQPHCEKSFRFLGDGRILPIEENGTAGQDTINILNLNHPDLIENRAEIFSVFQEKVMPEIRQCKSKKERQKVAQKYQKQYLKLKKRQYRSYWDVFNYFLQHYLT